MQKSSKIEPRIGFAINTGSVIVTAKMRIEFEADAKTERVRILRFNKPSEEEREKPTTAFEMKSLKKTWGVQMFLKVYKPS